MPITGVKEIVANLRAIANAATPSVRKRARQKALKPIQEAAKRNLLANGSVETRALAGGIIVGDGNKENKTLVGMKRGRRGRFNRLAPRYAHLVEFGTSPHYQPNRFGGIFHPGAVAKPYMRPAFEAYKHEVVQIYNREIWTAIVSKVKR